MVEYAGDIGNLFIIQGEIASACGRNFNFNTRIRVPRTITRESPEPLKPLFKEEETYRLTPQDFGGLLSALKRR